MAFPTRKYPIFSFCKYNYPSKKMAILPVLVPGRGKGKMATLYRLGKVSVKLDLARCDFSTFSVIHTPPPSSHVDSARSTTGAGWHLTLILLVDIHKTAIPIGTNKEGLYSYVHRQTARQT